ANAPQYTSSLPFSISDAVKARNDYDYVSCKVAGVSFKNGRRYRQTILRQIKFEDAPYDIGVDVSLKLTEYEGKPAIEVWTNEEQIGYVPKSELPFFVNNWNRYVDVEDIDIVGGGETDDDEKLSY